MKKIIIVLICLFYSSIVYAQENNTIPNKYLFMISNKQYSTAINNLSEFIKTNPKNFNGYYWRGISYLKLKRYQKAIEDFNKTIQLKTNFSYAYLYRAICFFEQKEYQKSMKDMKKAVSFMPNILLTSKKEQEENLNQKISKYAWHIKFEVKRIENHHMPNLTQSKFIQLVTNINKIFSSNYNKYISSKIINDSNLRKIINKNAYTSRIINRNGTGSIYVIGQVHPSPEILKRFTNKYLATYLNELEKQDPPSIPNIQIEIALLLHDLIKQNNLELIIGEGIDNIKLPKPSKKQKSFNRLILKYPEVFLHRIKNKENFLGYILLKNAYPNITNLIEADDIIEVNQIFNIHKERNRDISNNNTKPLRLQEDFLNKKRSSIYLQTAIKKADKQGKKDVAIVIGLAHVPDIIAEYKGKRKLYILYPKSVHNKDIQAYLHLNNFFEEIS